ncbi:MAG: DUF4376 domain-containing protein [Alistipes sp.]|nr:DUF4376 domain-containing protein [Alistipes sp.]
MKEYTKQIDGKTVIKPQNEIVVFKDGRQWFNPSHAMLIEDGWEEYVIPEPTEEELLAKAKRAKVREVQLYDSSEEVNIFYIQDLPVWLDKATRAGLKLRFEAELAMGKEQTTLWYGNTQFPLPLSQAVQMLYAIEVYASACYDNTQAHLANIHALTTIEEVEAYDYTYFYPEKLRF